MGADGTEGDDEPDNPRAWCDLAVISLNTGRPEAALRAATAAVDLDPLNEWGQRLVSLALTRLGRGADAVAPAREAVRLSPGSWPARLRLASVLRHEPGQWEEALAHAVLAARFAPEEPDPRVLLADLALVRGEHRE
ncbi:MAG: hypothetical protein HOV86_02225, partial [Thermoactinospora sp.]|nr:hypothetical protein [Thermoactinospora sp.]